MRTTSLNGWWRLWMVTAAIYGIGVAIVTWQLLPTVASTPYDASQLKLLSDHTLLVLGGRVQPPVRPDKEGWETAAIVLEMPNGHTFRVVSTTTPEQSKEVAQDYVSILSSIAREKRASVVLWALLVWIVPCLALLALGLVTRWVYLGFRRSEG